MFAIVVHVELPEGFSIEAAKKGIEEQVIPRVTQAPGFRMGHWMAPVAPSREGMSILLFDEEQPARDFAGVLQPPPPVRLIGTEVREVIANA